MLCFVRKVITSPSFKGLPKWYFQSIRSHNHIPKEVSIGVPWGHVAGLHWNENSSSVPVLCLHGWKDNAGSFNNIIPAILENTSKYQFLAIDLPGHGRSSHYPPGMLYQAIDSMIVIRRILRHYKWERRRDVHLMGHSLGAMLGFIFTSSHPKLIKCLITLDALVPLPFDKEDIVGMINTYSEGYLQVEAMNLQKIVKPTDKKGLLGILRKSHISGIDQISCNMLLPRGIVETPPNSGKYIFAHDPRAQFIPLMGFSMEQIEYLARCFESNLLHISAENGVKYISDTLELRLKEWIAKNNKGKVKFLLAKNAEHHVHLGEPEKIINDIMLFLNSIK